MYLHPLLKKVSIFQMRSKHTTTFLCALQLHVVKKKKKKKMSFGPDKKKKAFSRLSLAWISVTKPWKE